MGSEVRFSVADPGVGIAEAQLTAIFERFWQVTPGHRRGLGLGLFTSKCIVEAHGGRIWASSQPGNGYDRVLHTSHRWALAGARIC
jgi:chemotaxis family two-component system sensor kinase Cph1